VTFNDNLDVDLEAGPRQSIGLRNCHLDDSGKRRGAGVDLQASGETVEAPTLLAENTHAAATDIVVVELSGGSNLDLLAQGDLIVLSSDPDDIDDHWTSLKATRGGVVQKVISQTTATASIKLASATGLPRAQAGDVVRVVGRFGTALVDSVGASTTAGDFIWLHADNHARVFAAHNPMPREQIELGGANSDLRHWPGLGGEAVEISGVELDRGAVNGALTRLYTFEIAQDTAISFTPQSPIGLLHVFSHGALGDPAAAVLSYRADALGYTQIVAKSTYPVPAQNPAMSDVEVVQLTPLTGTTGDPNVFTFSAHTDGKIYVENRKVGSPRTVSLFVVCAPL
jgi:hypothetical protein